MFCKYQLSNLSTPENIEEVKSKWKKKICLMQFLS